MKQLIPLCLLSALILCACSRPAPADSFGNDIVYEMNIRQYTPEGSFAAAQQHLPRLRELGVDIVWLMPIHPIGVEGRKGTLGSYYAPRDYRDVNPEYGTLADFDAFVAEAHRLGLKVIIDWVGNHTSPDAVWTSEKPADWYVRDSAGNFVIQYDWTDIAKLDYDRPDMRLEMTDCLRFWLKRGVDGFRCDVAGEMPVDFWQQAITTLRREFPGSYWLGEGEKPEMHDHAFDATYAWELHHLLNDIARNKAGKAELKAYLDKNAANYPADALRLMFTSNHDENSWSGTEFERMGDAWEAMAALCFTLPCGQPLIYTGQEVGMHKRFQFFEKDAIESWEANAYTDSYRRLCDWRHRHACLAADGGFEWLPSDDNQLLFLRYLPQDTVQVCVNLDTHTYEFYDRIGGERLAGGSLFE